MSPILQIFEVREQKNKARQSVRSAKDIIFAMT